jgi:hypothetical protein
VTADASTRALLEQIARDIAAIRERQPATAPPALSDGQLAAAIPIGLSSFYRRKRRGEFRFLELKPQLREGNTLYSGALVARWLNGEAMPDAPAGRSFFNGARRAPAQEAQRRRPGRPKRLAREVD